MSSTLVTSPEPVLTAEGRRRLEGRLANLTAEVAEDPAIVEVGDEVDVEHQHGQLETYAVVHPAEADAVSNRVSALAPVGKALLGARPGDRVNVHAPAGEYSVVVRARRRLP